MNEPIINLKDIIGLDTDEINISGKTLNMTWACSRSASCC